MPNQGNTSGPQSPIQLQKYLKGVDYPVSKSDLVKKAQENNAPADVIQSIQRMQDGTFNKPTDVTKAFSASH